MLWRRPPIRPVLQMEVAECGAASLAMVLGAHGREIALEEARERCGTSRDGVDAAALVRAAESYGLTVKALRREPETLGDLPLPAILHWSFDHFVVLEKIRGTRFTVLDPAAGRRVVDADEMDRCFTGLAIAMVPGEKFLAWRPSAVGDRRAGGAGAGIVGRDRRRVSLRHPWNSSRFPAVGCGGNFRRPCPWTNRDAVADRYARRCGSCRALLQASLGALREWTVASLKTKIGVVVAARAFHHALFLPLSFFAQRHASEVVSRLRIGSELGATIAGPLARILPNVVTAAAYVAVIALYDWMLGLVVAAVSLLNLVVLNGLSRRLVETNRLQHVLEGTAGGVATAGFAAFDAFRLLGRQDLMARKWLAAEEAALDAEQRLGLVRTLASLGPVAAGLLVVTVVLCVGAWRVMQGDLSVGGLLALQVLAGLCSVPIAALASRLLRTAGSCRRPDAARRSSTASA